VSAAPPADPQDSVSAVAGVGRLPSKDAPEALLESARRYRTERTAFASTTNRARGQVLRMAFGPFKVKTSFGESNIASSAAAMAFVRSLGPSYRATYHWKVAERMLEVAWTSAEAENLAAQAFKIALETDGWLIG
jgi:hypothetical protein